MKVSDYIANFLSKRTQFVFGGQGGSVVHLHARQFRFAQDPIGVRAPDREVHERRPARTKDVRQRRKLLVLRD